MPTTSDTSDPHQNPKVMTDFDQMLSNQGADSYFKSDVARKKVDSMVNQGGISRFFDGWEISQEAMAEDFAVLAASALDSTEAVERHALKLAAAVYKRLLNDEGTALRDDIKMQLGETYEKFRELPPGSSDLEIAQKLTQGFLTTYLQAVTQYYNDVVLPEQMRQFEKDPATKARLARHLEYKYSNSPEAEKGRLLWFANEANIRKLYEFSNPISTPLEALAHSNDFMERLQAEVDGRAPKVVTQQNPAVKINTLLTGLVQRLEDYRDDLTLQYNGSQDEKRKQVLLEIQNKVIAALTILAPLKTDIGELRSAEQWQAKLNPLLGDLRAVMDDLREITPFSQGFKGFFERCYYQCCKLIGYKSAKILSEEEMETGLYKTLKLMDSKFMIDALNQTPSIKGAGSEYLKEFKDMTADQIAVTEIIECREKVASVYREYSGYKLRFEAKKGIVGDYVSELKQKIETLREKIFAEEMSWGSEEPDKASIAKMKEWAEQIDGHKKAIKELESPNISNASKDQQAKLRYAQEIMSDLNKHKFKECLSLGGKTLNALKNEIRDLSQHPDLDFQTFAKLVNDKMPSKYEGLKQKTKNVVDLKQSPEDYLTSQSVQLNKAKKAAHLTHQGGVELTTTKSFVDLKATVPHSPQPSTQSDADGHDYTKSDFDV